MKLDAQLVTDAEHVLHRLRAVAAQVEHLEHVAGNQTIGGQAAGHVAEDALTDHLRIGTTFFGDVDLAVRAVLDGRLHRYTARYEHGEQTEQHEAWQQFVAHSRSSAPP